MLNEADDDNCISQSSNLKHSLHLELFGRLLPSRQAVKRLPLVALQVKVMPMVQNFPKRFHLHAHSRWHLDAWEIPVYRDPQMLPPQLELPYDPMLLRPDHPHHDQERRFQHQRFDRYC